MDILLIDPPYTSLKNIATNRGYNVGLTSLSAYLRSGDIDSAVLTGDLLTQLPSYDAFIHGNLKTYAAGQRNYEMILNSGDHLVWRNIANYINQTKPKMIGIPYLTPLKCVVEKIAGLAKGVDKDIQVVVGSFHPTFCPEEVMQNPNIDFVIRGEGEIPLLALVKELKKDRPQLENVSGIHYRDKAGQVKSNAMAQPIADLDGLPFPARDLVLNCDFNKYRAHSICTTRGCPYSCSFCSDKGFWGGKARRRSVPNVIEELIFIKNNYKKIDYVDILDGTFTFDRKYLQLFCNAIVDSKINLKWRCTARYDNLDKGIIKMMKDAGCDGLYLGAESGSDRILNTIDKRISVEEIIKVSQMVYDSGIPSVTAFILGLPDENAEDAKETLKLMRKIKTDILDINSYLPLPGAALYSSVSEEEKNDIDWQKVGYKSYGNYFSKKMSRDEFDRYRAEAYEIAASLQKKTIIRFALRMALAPVKRIFK